MNEEPQPQENIPPVVQPAYSEQELEAIRQAADRVLAVAFGKEND